MIALPFDTLSVRQRLVTAGFTEKQADEAVTIAREVATNVLATKADLRELEMRITMRFGSMLAVAVVVLGVFDLVAS